MSNSHAYPKTSPDPLTAVHVSLLPQVRTLRAILDDLAAYGLSEACRRLNTPVAFPDEDDPEVEAFWEVRPMTGWAAENSLVLYTQHVDCGALTGAPTFNIGTYCLGDPLPLLRAGGPFDTALDAGLGSFARTLCRFSSTSTSGARCRWMRLPR